MSEAKSSSRLAETLYRIRWPAAVLTLGAILGAFNGGWMRVEQFSAQVAALGDNPPEKPQPQMFDPRSDIWFDPEDSALGAYGVLEERFIPEDFVFLSLREEADPLGAFGVGALAATARLTEKLEKIPYVRNVRSLTQNPWIRWGEAAPGEEGLLVSDMFEEAPETYSKDERLERMVSVLGAERASKLAGAAEVSRILGPDADPADHLGEPRLLKGVVSEDGRTSAIQIQVLRPSSTEEKLTEVFGDDEVKRAVGPVIYKSVVHKEVVEAIDTIIAGEPDYALHVTGQPVLEKHFQDVGQGDMAYVGLMFVIIALVLFAIYRRLGGMGLPLLVVFTTIMGMFGTVWLKGDLLNNLTAIAPTMMTGVAVADAVHLVTAYYLLRPSHTDKRALIQDVLARNALPVFLTTITTAAGFFSLASSIIIPVRSLGYTAGLGALLAYLLTMTVVPALLSLLPVRNNDASKVKVTAPEDGEHWADGLVGWVVRARTPLMVVTAALFALSFFGISRMVFSSDMRIMFAKGDVVAADVIWFEDYLGGVGDLELLFYSSDDKEDGEATRSRQERIAALEVRRIADGETPLSAAEKQELGKLREAEAQQQRLRIATNAQFLDQLDRFQQRVMQEAEKPGSRLSVISRMDSGLDVLRKMHQVQNENKAAFYRVPNDTDVAAGAREARVIYDDILEESTYIPAQTADSLVAQYYLQYENGAKPSENLASLITPDRRGFRLTTRFDVAPSGELLEGFDQMEAILHDEFPMLAGTQAEVDSGKALATMTMTGKQFMFTNMFDRFSDTMVTSLSIALACITLLISLVFRSPILGLLSLIPNVLPIILPLAVMGLLGIAIDGPSVVVASVALGVCVDDTIHMFTKFVAARKQGYPVEESLRRAFRQVGSALTWTTVVLVLGFSVLTLSTFRPNIVTGYLGALMIGLAWVADFILTPALLSYLGRSQEAQVAPVAASAE